MRMSFAIALLAVAVAVTGTPCFAGTTVVEQSGKKFSESEISVKKGDTVTFANKDPITHNVYSQSPGNAFDVKTQKPGESSDVKFDTAGDVDVQCAIHPSMKLRIHVGN
ncbi:cupredoxin domain-containing protein [Azospirillum sp. sgz302134]